MYKMFLFITLISISFIFSGCSNVKFETELKASDFNSGKEIQSSARVFVDIDRCSHPRDPYEQSGVLKYANKTIGKIFTGAQFSHCEEGQYSYTAVFDIPIFINSSKKGNSYIKINSDQDGYLNIYIPTALTNNAESELSGNFSISNPRVSASISFYNDSDNDIEVSCRSAFIDNKPMICQNMIIESHDAITIDISKIALIEMLKNEIGVILK